MEGMIGEVVHIVCAIDLGIIVIGIMANNVSISNGKAERTKEGVAATAIITAIVMFGFVVSR